MTFISKHLGKATKVLVAGAVLGSISFGAYGFGHAARPQAAKPRELYVGYNDNWTAVPSYCDGGCDWERLTTMTSVTVPRGNYILTAGASVFSDADANHITCEIDPRGRGGFSYQTYSSLDVPGSDFAGGFSDGQMIVTGVASATGVRNEFVFRCGLFDTATSGTVEIHKIFIRAERVATLKNNESVPE